MVRKYIVTMIGLLGIGAYVTRRKWLGLLLGLTPSKYAVRVVRGITIPMPDGVRLVADHYAPKAPGKFPTILMRTPYGRNEEGGVMGTLNIFFAQRLAERGYNVIFQDTRGRFDSEGEFEPFVDESRDGVATLEWIAQQPWFDGHIGMWGSSYGGYVQWAAAADAPNCLKAIVPSVAATEITPFVESAFVVDGIVRWMLVLSRTERGIRSWFPDFSQLLYTAPMERMLQKAFNELPIGGIDERVIGKPVPYFRKWILPENAHTNATFWRSLAHGTKMQQVRAAAHIIGGWYDIFLAQALRDYAALREAGRTPYLTIGNWRHVDIDCAWETLRSSIDWYDAHLKGQPDRLREKPVRIFLMSANRWLEYDGWPPPAQPIRFYLQGQGQLGVDAPPENCLPDHYRYDPAHPTPALGGPMYQPGAGVVDNRPLEARHDVISFSTSPLESDVDVIGHVFLELYARTSALSADFFARLCDVYPDGRSINLCDGGTRVNVRTVELQPDGSFRILIELWATANRFKRGHKIRLLVMSGQHPRFARNLGTDEPIAAATRMIVADQTIYHDAARPSALIIPIAGDVE